MQTLVNIPLTIPVQTALINAFLFLLGGATVPLVSTMSPVSSGLSTLTVTPTGTGPLFILDTQNSLSYGPYEVVVAPVSVQVQQLVDGVLGSWQWNKVTNVLTFYAQNGSVLETYTFQDSPTVSSRQLLT